MQKRDICFSFRSVTGCLLTSETDLQVKKSISVFTFQLYVLLRECLSSSSGVIT